jgi:beta-mannosidase
MDRPLLRAATFAALGAGVGALLLLSRCTPPPRAAPASTTDLDLDGTWLAKDYPPGVGVAQRLYLLRAAPDDSVPVQVPGTIRDALRRAGKIPDPYVGYDNEKSLWSEQREWWFFRKAAVPSELLGKHVDLRFEGTTFRGEVWINGRPAGALEGMLNPRSFDVSRLLEYGRENTIVVRLEAVPDAALRDVKDGLTWYTPRGQLFSVAQCLYGWDWGPHGVPVGIWQAVRLRASGSLRIDHPYVRTEILSSTAAKCSVDLDVHDLSTEPKEVRVRGELREKDSKRKVAAFEQTTRLSGGESRTVHAELEVPDPKLWWPNGMGDPSLYVLDASISDATGESDTVSTRFGIRELKLVENEGASEFVHAMKQQPGGVYDTGKAVGSYPWTFRVNGKKMFAKGGNWIPVDQLLRLDRDRYQRLLVLARDAHFNLLRVWGGGLYETEDFYELCDEYGILTWQEFLSNNDFSKIDRANFLDGAESAVLRLRNHPSLAFWCGGNEFDPDDQRSKAVVDSLGTLLERRDPQREFHRASPYMGDDHYWGVWHGQEPYTAYRVVRPFRSEAGISAAPVLEDYRRFTPETQRWPLDAAYVEYHGESNAHHEHLRKLLRYAGEFGEPAGLEDFIRKGQLYQALGDAFDLEFCRSNKFKNSGFLVWQYDDIWPAISWSIVDWYGTPKAAYYFLKRAARPLHVAVDFPRYVWKPGETFAANAYVLNDTEAVVSSGTVAARLLDVSGGTLANRTAPARAEANRSARVATISYEIPQEASGRTFFASVELKDDEGRLVSDVLYPIAVSASSGYEGIFAEMTRMPAAAPKVEVVRVDPGSDATAAARVSVRLSNPSTHLAFFVRLRMLEESDALRTSYSDNYVSLLPGASRTIEALVEAHENRPDKVHFEVSGWNSPAQEVEVALH